MKLGIKLFRDPYHEAELYAAAEAYKSSPTRDPVLLDKLLRCTAPLIGRVYRIAIAKLKPLITGDEVCVNALEYVYGVYIKFNIELMGKKKFTGFMYKNILRSLLDSIRKSTRKEYDFEYGRADYHISYPLGPEDVLVTRSRAQFDDLAISIFKKDCVFEGFYGNVCEFIAKCLLHYKNKEPKSAIELFRLTTTEYKELERYSTVLLKTTGYYLRSLDET